MKATLFFVIATVLAVGCARHVSSTRLLTTTAALQAAEQSGAAQIPVARDHLQLAQREEAQARELMKSGHSAAAEGYLRRAEADANLAVALARRAGLQREADQANARLQALRPAHRM
jgi:hypothetical protein